jgi:DNA-binding PadR family transcriptional regulator
MQHTATLRMPTTMSPRTADNHLGRHLHGRGADHPGSWIHDIFDPFREGIASVRRGKMRQLILAVLHDHPMHGYQVIQELEARSGGRWRPSAGSVYPTLQLLEDEGLVSSQEVDGRRVYSLTDEGRTAADASPLTRHPWFDAEAGTQAMDTRRLAVQLIGAAVQVKRVGSPAAQREAHRILVDSRRRLYRLLADDEPADDEPVDADESVTQDKAEEEAPQ